MPASLSGSMAVRSVSPVRIRANIVRYRSVGLLALIQLLLRCPMLRSLSLLSLLLLIGCAQPASDGAQDGGPSGANPPGLQLPFPTREPSDLTEYVLDGTETELRSAGASEIGTALVLDGVASGFEYGVYRFNLLSEAPDSVSVLLE